MGRFGGYDSGYQPVTYDEENVAYMHEDMLRSGAFEQYLADYGMFESTIDDEWDDDYDLYPGEGVDCE